MSVKMPVEAIAGIIAWAENSDVSDVSWEIDTIKADSWFAEIRIVSEEEVDLDCIWESLGVANLSENVAMLASLSRSDFKSLIVFHVQGKREREWEMPEDLKDMPF